MIAEFSILPMGGGIHLSSRLAKVLSLVHASGLDYKLGPMGTSVEGSWDQVMRLIKRCYRQVLSDHDRVWLSIKVDGWREGKTRRLARKVDRVVRKSGRRLKT